MSATQPENAPPAIRATPFVYQDPQTLPMRDKPLEPEEELSPEEEAALAEYFEKALLAFLARKIRSGSC